LILSASGKLPQEAQVFTDEFRHRTFVITHEETSVDVLPPQQVIRLSTLRPFPFEELYEKLAMLGVHSLWLEGGSNLHTLFLTNGQVQRITIYKAPKIMGQGIDLFDLKLPNIQRLIELQGPEVQLIGHDIKISGRIN